MVGRWLKIKDVTGIPDEDKAKLEERESEIEKLSETVTELWNSFSEIKVRHAKDTFICTFFETLHTYLMIKHKFPLNYTLTDSENFCNSLQVGVDCMQDVDDMIQKCVGITIGFDESLTTVSENDGEGQIHDILKHTAVLLKICKDLHAEFTQVHDKYEAAHTTYTNNKDQASFEALGKCIMEITEELRTASINPVLNTTKRVLWQVMTHMGDMIPKAEKLIF
jgi:hypothetical protein